MGHDTSRMYSFRKLAIGAGVDHVTHDRWQVLEVRRSKSQGHVAC